MKSGKIKKFWKGLTATVLVLCMICCALVYLLDPFYHYHEPWFGLKAVLTEKEYQVVGSLRNFEYDTVLVGSSVVENNDNRWYDEIFGGTTIKAVRSYGGIADLVWYLEIAFDTQENIQTVIFNLDPSALIQEAETTFEASGCPMYLYDENPFNDIKYLLNKTVLLEKIPYMLAQSFSSSYEEALSYNWAEGKNFSEEGVLLNYARLQEVSEMADEASEDENVQANIELLCEIVEAHPHTQFVFFIPPYSMIWWDDAVRSGLRDVYLYAESCTAQALLSHENVRFFDFQNETDIVTNLSYYMDTVHFSPEINYEICQAIAQGRCEITADEIEETFALTKELVDQYEKGEIAQLEAEDKFIYSSS